MSTAFELLHHGLQRQLYKMAWPELRPLQVESIRAVHEGDDHLILSAATASGKTEAAFLPVLSKIADDPLGSVRAMYVGPLKALINDQFGRLEELCTHLEMPVHRWHGDVGAASKTKLVKEPGGVLLITPESLESLFVNRSSALPRLFGGLRFVVIDELHAFISTERGTHLRSLLFRVASVASPSPRLIGLSATLGDPEVARTYLRTGSARDVRVLSGDGGLPPLKLKVHAYVDAGVQDAATPTSGDEPLLAHEELMARDIVKHCKGKSNLVFANSRDDVELFGERASRIGEELQLPDRFMVHHGSLSAEFRIDAEATMKEASGGTPATTFCTSTLEMGIDIGSVAMVGQIGPPASIAGLTQRVGRSGRKDGAARVCRMYLRCREVNDKSILFERLHLGLVQAAAASELLVRSWVEPLVIPTFDLSTLAQQVISVIAETGGTTAMELHRRLCREGAFGEVARPMFAALLRQLGRVDVIEQAPDGTLILGLVGERLRKDKGFYAVFLSADEFAVSHDGATIGSIASPPPVNDHLILAGRRWRVTGVDLESKTVLVVPAHGCRAPAFSGGGGALHDGLVEQMRCVLAERRAFPQLDATATTVLEQARAAALHASACTRRLFDLGPRRAAVLSWRGTAAHAVIAAMLKSRGIECVDEIAGLDCRASKEEVRRAIATLLASPPSIDDLAPCFPVTLVRKYDDQLDPELQWIQRRPSAELFASAVDTLSQIAGAERQ